MNARTLVADFRVSADDIVLICSSCTDLQQTVNVCTAYDLQWDISFNPMKVIVSHLQTTKRPLAFNVYPNHSVNQWANKLK